MPIIEKRAGRDGVPVYRMRIRLKGYPEQSATFERLTDARKWAQATEAAIREGRHFKAAEAKRHTLGEAIDRYCRDVLPQKRSSAAQVHQYAWWKRELGAYSLADIRPALIAEHRDKLAHEVTCRGRLRTPATVNRYLAALSHVLSVAVKEWGWLEDSPARKVRKPREPRGRVRFLSDAERERLLEACQASGNRYLYPVVVLAISTGMRLGEIMRLTWPDVDLARGRAILHETKNNERRAVPLTGHALAIVQDLARVRRLDTALLFPSRHDPAKPVDIRVPWDRAVAAAGIEDFRFHDLRHTAASYLLMNGASLAEIAEVLGHKTLAMVKRYAHLAEGHTHGIVSRMNERIFKK